MHIFSLELLFAFVFITIIRYFSSSCFSIALYCTLV
nr:MAG TPA: hypothetical protein [Caudoviricetes sp.]